MNLCRRRYIPTICLGICIFCLVTSGASAQLDTETVADSAFPARDRMRPPVAFSHDAHNERAGLYDCTVCHHAYVNGRKLKDTDSAGVECSQCHLPDPDSNLTALIRVYHLQCRNCHLREKAGPIICGQCHSQ